MRTNSDNIGPIRKAILKLLTKLQEKTVEKHNRLYYFFTKLGFRIYVGISLKLASKEILSIDTRMFNRAAERHARMVLSIVYKDSTYTHKKALKPLIKESFKKNFLLDQEL